MTFVSDLFIIRLYTERREKLDKVKDFLKSTDGIVLNTEDLTPEEQWELIVKKKQATRDATAKQLKQEEDDLVIELEKHLDNKDIPSATNTAIEFLTKVYGSELLGIWGLRYYKKMTKGDVTPFDKASTKLLQMRGDIK